MSRISIPLLSILLFTLVRCTHAPLEDISPGLDRPPGALLSSAPYFNEAAHFDLLLQGKTSTREIESALIQCKSDSTNPFCPSIRHLKQLMQIRESKLAVRQVMPIKAVVPVAPEWKNGKITNWKMLRKASVQSLLKGLLALDSKEFHALEQQALREAACPNNPAIAMAATLEDLLPSHAEVSRIAQLYQKGARCASREPVDREHFLTRAALLYVLLKQPQRAEKILAKVRPTDAFSGRALYWLYKVRAELKNEEGSKRAFRQLVSQHPFSFHALLAMTANGQDPGARYLENREILKNRSEKNTRLNQFLYQIELLGSHRLEKSANILVDWLLSQQIKEPGVRLYAASLGDAKARVVTGSDLLFSPSLLTRQTMELIYPRPYFQLFSENAAGSVSPFLGLAVSRKESLFNPYAVSVANAQGLLQLNPDTAAKMSGGRSSDLFDPRINIELGMRYIKELLSHFSGNVIEAIAGYNAGEEAVAIWKKRFPDVEPVLWMDLIPYRETRDYVGYVLANYFWYRRLYGPANEVPKLF